MLNGGRGQDSAGVSVKVLGGGPASIGAVTGNFGGIVNRKVLNVRSLSLGQDLNKVNRVWLGDNGQGDVEVARELLQSGDISAAFIHIVDKKKLPTGLRARNHLDPISGALPGALALKDDQDERIMYFHHYGQVAEALKTTQGYDFTTAVSGELDAATLRSITESAHVYADAAEAAADIEADMHQSRPFLQRLLRPCWNC